ncbi:Hypothetical_protein [Hexamita inflata]|uniref:Hypothetical_protein n=1 Tax=Hexamita inflata TaxID=28002 RepID=A0AA86PGV8_9EUKA|nr:Hypothetical protein HINF_LOCUS25691 [Hexamita inflata]
MPQSNAKSPQKETQKNKEDKQPALEKPVKQPKDGQNEYKRQLTQNRKPSQFQRKPRRKSKLKNIRNSLSNNRELRKISKRLNPRKQLIYHRQYTPKLGICKNKQTKKDPQSSQ